MSSSDASAPPAGLDLRRVLSYLLTARREALSAQVNAHLPDKAATVEKSAALSVDALNAAIGRLQAAGVEAAGQGDAAPSDGLSLSALSSLASLNTNAARELRGKLQDVLDAAERLDRERGNWYENAPPSDTPGTDYAESVHQLLCRLDLELSGPSKTSFRQSRGGE